MVDVDKKDIQWLGEMGLAQTWCPPFKNIMHTIFPPKTWSRAFEIRGTAALSPDCMEKCMEKCSKNTQAKDGPHINKFSVVIPEILMPFHSIYRPINAETAIIDFQSKAWGWK